MRKNFIHTFQILARNLPGKLAHTFNCWPQACRNTQKDQQLQKAEFALKILIPNMVYLAKFLWKNCAPNECRISGRKSVSQVEAVFLSRKAQDFLRSLQDFKFQGRVKISVNYESPLRQVKYQATGTLGKLIFFFFYLKSYYLQQYTDSRLYNGTPLR